MPTSALCRSETSSSSAGLATHSSVLAHIKHWRGLTQQGHEAFERHHDVQARQLYEEALAEAEALFEVATFSGDDDAVRFAPPLYCISCNEVVALACRQGDLATAGIFAYRAFSRLLAIAEGQRFSLALRCRAALYLNTATSALVQHLERDGQSATARHHAERAGTAIDLVRRLEQAAGWSARLQSSQSGVAQHAMFPDDSVQEKLH